jgi:GntR family transcriptional regulator/MocR family aminotransferase
MRLSLYDGGLDLLYLTPLHGFPTTVTMPIARRRMVYQIALRNHVPIIEDDFDHEFHFRAQPPFPIASDDPAELVIYSSTLLEECVSFSAHWISCCTGAPVRATG